MRNELPALCLAYLSPLLPAVKSRKIEQGVSVLVVPGLLSCDATTSRLRRSLTLAGFDTYRWAQGWNLGFRPGMLASGVKRLETVAQHSGQQVIILGWSLGGLYAREIAKIRPDLVRAVVTLASPFSGDVHANNAWRVYEFLNDHKVDALPDGIDLTSKPHVPTIAIWSPDDGIISPASARGRDGEADRRVEIKSSHMGMGVMASSIHAIVNVLAEI